MQELINAQPNREYSRQSTVADPGETKIKIRQHGEASLSTANFEEISMQENHLEQNITEEATTVLFEDCHLK